MTESSSQQHHHQITTSHLAYIPRRSFGGDGMILEHKKTTKIPRRKNGGGGMKTDDE